MFQHSTPHIPDKPVETFQRKLHRCVPTFSPTSRPPAVSFKYSVFFFFLCISLSPYVSSSLSFSLYTFFLAFLPDRWCQLLIYSSPKEAGAATYRITPLLVTVSAHRSINAHADHRPEGSESQKELQRLDKERNKGM